MIKFETKFEREAWVMFAANAISRGTGTTVAHATEHADRLLEEMIKRNEFLKRNVDTIYKEGV
jgi:hypothetical protein